MKLSVRGEYALRALLVLARDFQEDDSVVSIQEISQQQNIPKRFLEQILNDLKSAGGQPILISGIQNGYLVILVAYDDGTIQRELDSKYGADIVLVRSALRPPE